MSSNLPQSVNLDSAENVKIFFNAYGEKRQSFLTNEIDATVGFFTSKGFDRVSATSKKEAEDKMKKFYPKDKVTGSKLIG